MRKTEEVNKKVSEISFTYDWEHPRTHMATNQNDDTMGLLNWFGQNIMCLPIREGEKIENGETVLIDDRGQAYPLRSLKDCEFIHFNMSMGEALFSAVKNNDFNTNVVLVKGNAVIRLNNTTNEEFMVKDEQFSNICYYEDSATATMDSTKALAGRIMSVEGDIVFVVIDPKWRLPL